MIDDNKKVKASGPLTRNVYICPFMVGGGTKVNIEVKLLNIEPLISEVKKAFEQHGITRDEEYFEKCFKENQEKKRFTLLAYADGKLAGCAHLIIESDYPFYQNNNIPEVNDLNVFPLYRRQGIASLMLDKFEQICLENGYLTIGIGVGLYKDYGKAQRLYVKKGYILMGMAFTMRINKFLLERMYLLMMTWFYFLRRTYDKREQDD